MSATSARATRSWWPFGCVLPVALALGLLASPLAVEAQPAGRVYRLGILLEGAPPIPPDRATQSLLVPTALRELGYAEGQNLLVERRFAGGKRDRLSGLARELVQLRVDIIVAVSNEATQAAKDATTTIPIVMLGGSVVERGFVASLAQPGGNITGVAISETTLSARRLELPGAPRRTSTRSSGARGRATCPSSSPSGSRWP